MERGREEVMEGGRIYCFSALEQAHLEPWRYKITHSLRHSAIGRGDGTSNNV